MTDQNEETEYEVKVVNHNEVAESPPPTLDEQFKVGYLVGVTPEGKFVFQVLGSEKTLGELVATHKHATDKIEQVWDSQFNRGTAVQNLIATTLVELNQKLNVVLTSTPENKL